MQDIYMDGKNNMRIKSRNGLGGKISRAFALSLFLGVLTGFDFLLYLRSGSVSLSENGFNLPAFISFGYIVSVVFVSLFVFFFSRVLQSLVFALACVALTWGIMGQFLQVNPADYLQIALSDSLDPSIANLFVGISHFVILGVVFILAYVMASRASQGLIGFLVGILLCIIVAFFGIDLLSVKSKKSVMEVYTSANQEFADEAQKYVFLFAPRATSVLTIDQDAKNEFNKDKQLYQVEMGFLARNGFKLYQNAYELDKNQDNRVVELINMLDNQPAAVHIRKNFQPENLWKFKKVRKNTISLKDNQLSDVFTKAKYKVSAYKNGRIDLCKANGQYVVDRCVERNSAPFDVPSASFTVDDRTGLFLGQWLRSFGVFDNQLAIDVIQQVMDRNTAKKLALPYEQVYTVNSVDVLQKLLEDIAKDTQAGVYIVYLDMPDNLLVHDEWCRLKKPANWNMVNSSVNLPGMSANGDYNEQMMCFWGQMGEFMQQLKAKGLDENLTIVLHGLIPVKDKTAMADNVTDNFKARNSVLLAIHEAKGDFSVKTEICSSKDILRHYLFNAPLCEEFKGLALSEADQTALKQKLDGYMPDSEAFAAINEGYDQWLEQWSASSKPQVKEVVKAKKEKVVRELLPDEISAKDAVNAVMTASVRKAMEERAAEEKKIKFSVKSMNVSDMPLEHKVIEKQPETTKTEAPKAEVQTVETPKADATKTESAEKQATVSKPVMQKAPQAVAKPKPAPIAKKQAVQQKPVAKKQVVQQKPVVQKQVVRVQEVAPQNVAQPQIQPQVVEVQTVTVPVQDVQSGAMPVHEVQTVTVPVHEVQTVTVPVSETGVPVTVNGDFLIEGETAHWELNPAQALGVSGDSVPDQVIIKVK